MNFSSFFSEQARKPKGMFGHVIMSAIFNIGNAKLNELVNKTMSVQDNDHVFEIGFGTGKLIDKMARQIKQGVIEGVDFSEIMVSIAEKRNRAHIATGKVKIKQGDFDEIPLNKEYYNKVCSVNTIYFWKKPEFTARRVAVILKPEGKFVVGFEDKRRKLDSDVFHLYSKADVKKLLLKAGFSNIYEAKSKQFGSSALNCVVAIK
jgi:ubiquinone/menaquinone biosynthesis C-methylase UbiE